MTGLGEQDLRQNKTFGSRSQAEGSTGLEEHDPRQKGKLNLKYLDSRLQASSPTTPDKAWE